MTHPELIAALRAATQGSVELDETIAKEFGWISQMRPPAMWWQSPADKETNNWRQGVRRFSTSVDAALTLIRGTKTYIDLESTGRATVVLGPNDPPREAPTLPLAICIAALEAVR